MGKGAKGKATWKQEPATNKEVRIQASPESTDKQTPAWQFHKRDKDHEKWGWDKLSAEDFCELLHGQLAYFETMRFCAPWAIKKTATCTTMCPWSAAQRTRRSDLLNSRPTILTRSSRSGSATNIDCTA
jgi:hypothetical protein